MYAATSSFEVYSPSSRTVSDDDDVAEDAVPDEISEDALLAEAEVAPLCPPVDVQAHINAMIRAAIQRESALIAAKAEWSVS